MFERFTEEARAVVRTAEDEARAAGSPSIDAEHLLLALCAIPPAARRLADAGLDREAVVHALDIEEAASLSVVGVDAAEFAAARSRPLIGRRPRFGTSSKLALERALGVAKARSDRRIGALHVLLGVLAADYGRVPRAFELARVDREALRAAV